MSTPKHWLDRQLLCDEVAAEVSAHQAEQARKKSGSRK